MSASISGRFISMVMAQPSGNCSAPTLPPGWPSVNRNSSFVANMPSLSAAKGGALCSSTEAERAHPYSLESTRRPREATRGSALQDRRAVRDASHDTAYPFLVERVRIFCSEFVTAVRNRLRLGEHWRGGAVDR